MVGEDLANMSKICDINESGDVLATYTTGPDGKIKTVCSSPTARADDGRLADHTSD